MSPALILSIIDTIRVKDLSTVLQAPPSEPISPEKLTDIVNCRFILDYILFVDLNLLVYVSR